MQATINQSFLRFVLFLCLSGVALGAETKLNPFFSPNGRYVKVSNTNCLVWNSYPTTNETATWSGGVKDGKATGKGILRWFTNGVPTTSYEGSLQDGLANGPGVAKGNGFSWEGEWNKGILISKEITIIDQTGAKYVGEHRDGLKHGEGVLTYKDGNTYKGKFVDGFQDGKGEETLAGGQRYVGDFRKGRFNGKGTLFMPDGGKITGNWKDSQLDGVGQYMSVDGRRVDVKMVHGSIQVVQ